ncbi:MAG TPA: HAMP domain-containing sensor histidine kinase [Candidatus Saccharimonadales bacterium]
MTFSFRKALLRLTSLYVLILMTLALACSFWLFNVAGREVRTSLDEAAVDVAVITGAEEIGDESNRRLLQSLIFFNLFVFGAGTLASYVLAKRTLRTIEQNNLAQQEFVTDASHELRTPLTALKTELQLAQREASSLTPSEYAAVIGSALEEVVRLSTLSERLLRLSSVRAEPTAATSSLKDVVSVARKQLRRSLAAKQLKLAVPKDNVDLHITQDDLVEILVIVLDNAIKYSPKSGTISIRFTKGDEFVLITVQDQGPGIDPEDLPYIFDRFYRGKNDSQRGME